MARTNDYSSSDTDVRILLSLVTDETVTDEIVEYFIERGDNYIDGRLAKRYTVPFTQSTTPPILTDISANLAAYGVLKRLKLETNDTEDDYARTFYNDAMRMLRDIINGTLEILETNGNIVQPLGDTGIVSSTKDYKPIFNEGDEVAWKTSSDKIAGEGNQYK